MFSSTKAVLCGFYLAAVAMVASPFAQAASNPGDWAQLDGNSGNSKYSALTQITPANVSNLTKAWSHPGGGGSLTALAIDGVVYYPSGQSVYALDGDTGKEIWKTDL